MSATQAVNGKVYLTVPFSEKDKAKSLGARWDGDARRWYVIEGVPLEPFAPWLPGMSVTSTPVNSPAGLDQPAESFEGETKGITLSAFLGQVEVAIARHVLPAQWVQAEISQLRPTGGGHMALELVEHDGAGRLVARVQGFLWSNRAKEVIGKFEKVTGAKLVTGIKVLLKVTAEFSAPYGLRATVDDIDPSYTLGDIEAKLKAIRDTLTQEGVIDLNKKLPAPLEFCHVAVISPAEAAGLGDFRRDADRLHEARICRFDYYVAKFQGKDAPSSVLSAFKQVLADFKSGHRFDAVCVIRGGGSVTDLYWLNDLDLARALCLMPVPVFSGIGHERDNTILDEVAHKRCDTPSKVIGWINGIVYSNVSDAIQNMLSILKDAQSAIAFYEQGVESYFASIKSTAEQGLIKAEGEIDRVMDAIKHQASGIMANVETDIDRYLEVIRDAAVRQMRDAEQSIEGLAREVLGMGPKATLERGFALVRDDQNKPITSSKKAKEGGRIQIEFHDGRAMADLVVT